MAFDFTSSTIIAFALSMAMAYTLWAIGYAVGYKSKEFGKLLTQEQRDKKILSKKMVGVIVVGVYSIGAVIIVISILAGIPIKDTNGNDLSNWATLTIEVGLGASVAVVLFMYSQSGQKRQQEINEKRLKNAKEGIAFGVNELREHLQNVMTGIHEQYARGNVISTKPLTGFSEYEKNKANFTIKHIVIYHCENAHHLLDDDFEREVRGVCAEIPGVYIDIGSEEYEIKTCQELIDNIDYIKMEYLEGYGQVYPNQS